MQLGAPTGSRASLDFVRSAVGGRSRRLPSLQKFVVGGCSCRGVWAKARAQAAGYLCDGLCACGQRQTIKHCLRECMLPAVVAARAEAEVSPLFISA
eukprot:7069680-Pyramimonas_sp.AAC.1